MIRRLFCALALVGVIGCDRSKSADVHTPAAEPATAIGEWTIRADGYGPLSLGGPVTDANAALGEPLPIAFKDFDTCESVRSAKLPRGVLLMVERDSAGAPTRLERVSVDSGGVRTAEGASVGDTEDRIKQLYGNRVKVQPHKYTGPVGHYLIVDAVGDTTHRIVFETDGKRVTNFRAGRRPAVDYVEGCA